MENRFSSVTGRLRAAAHLLFRPLVTRQSPTTREIAKATRRYQEWTNKRVYLLNNARRRRGARRRPDVLHAVTPSCERDRRTCSVQQRLSWD